MHSSGAGGSWARSAIDLVADHDVGEDRAGGVENAHVLIEDATLVIARQQVRE